MSRHVDWKSPQSSIKILSKMDSGYDNAYYHEEKALFDTAAEALGSELEYIKVKGGYYVKLKGVEFPGAPTRGIFLQSNYDGLIRRGWNPPDKAKLVLFRDRSTDFGKRSKRKSTAVFLPENFKVEKKKRLSKIVAKDAQAKDQEVVAQVTPIKLFKQAYEMQVSREYMEELEEGRLFSSNCLYKTSLAELLMFIGKKIKNRLPAPDENGGRDRVCRFKDCLLAPFLSSIDVEILMMGLIQAGGRVLEAPRSKMKIFCFDLGDVKDNSSFVLRISADDLLEVIGAENMITYSWRFKSGSSMKQRLNSILKKKARNEDEVKQIVGDIAFRAVKENEFTDLERLEVNGISMFTGYIEFIAGSSGLMISEGRMDIFRQGLGGWYHGNIDLT